MQHLVPSGVWVRYAAAVKSAVGDLPVIASNRINSLVGAEEVLAAGSVDFISMARPFLADAEIVAKGARGQGHLVNTCIACNQACIDRSVLDEPVSCMVNPRAAREREFPEGGAPVSGRFAVVGGGPAGMESARALAALGHRVELFETQSELGGQFRMARRIPGKRDFGETIRYFTNELARLRVVVRLNCRLTDTERLKGFDGVVLATGVVPRKAGLTGGDLPHVVTYADVLLSDCPVGERVAIVGAGGIGVDVAHYLSFGKSNADESTRFLYEQGLAAPPDGALLVSGVRRSRSCGAVTRSASASARRHAGRFFGRCVRPASKRWRTSTTMPSCPAAFGCEPPMSKRVRSRPIRSSSPQVKNATMRCSSLFEGFEYRFASSAARKTRPSSTRYAPSRKDCAPRTSSIASLGNVYRLTCTRKPSDGNVNAGSDGMPGEIARLSVFYFGGDQYLGAGLLVT